MKKYFYLAVALVLLAAIALVGYGAWLNYSDENQVARRMDARSLHLTGAVAKERDIATVLPLPALRFTSDKMTDAVALTDGRILRWHVGKNDVVRQGDLLVTMTNEQIPLRLQQAASAVKKAEAVLAQANSSYQRQGRLMAKNATSREKYEEAEAQYLAAQEALREAEAQRDQYLVQEGWLSVTAPIEGTMLIPYQSEGAYVQAGTPIALVGDFDTLTFSLDLRDEDARRLRIGEISLLSLPDNWALNKAYDTAYEPGNEGIRQQLEATLVAIRPPLSEPASMRRALWEVDNRTHILEPVTYTGVTLQAGEAWRCLSVPLAAMCDKEHKRVLVVDGDGILHFRDVVAGTDDGKNVEIRKGLSEGEIVIVGNTKGLAEGMRAEVVLERDER